MIALAIILIYLGSNTQIYFSKNLFPSHDKTLIVNGSFPR